MPDRLKTRLAIARVNDSIMDLRTRPHFTTEELLDLYAERTRLVHQMKEELL